MEDGEQKGIMQTYDALRLAQELGLDLVEISARSHPPVCRIMDYGKFKYEQSKKKQQARKHASTVEVKEIKFRPKIEEHDMDFKTKHVRRFLEEGNKCRLVIIFRGREITHPETGRAVLNRVVEITQDISNVEVQPNMEGRRMVMILAPKAGVVRRSRQAKEAKPATTAKDGGAARAGAREARDEGSQVDGNQIDDDQVDDQIDDDDVNDQIDDGQVDAEPPAPAVNHVGEESREQPAEVAPPPQSE